MVIFAGANEADKEKEKKKYLLVRRDKLRGICNHLKNHVEAYKNIENPNDSTLLERQPVCGYVEDVITEEDADSHLLHETIVASDRANNGGIDLETHEQIVSGIFSLDERNAGEAYDRPVTLPELEHASVDVSRPATSIPSSDHPVLLSSPVAASVPPARIRVTTATSSKIISSKDKDFYYSAYPDLFPWGLASPNDQRATPCSRDEVLRHLLRKKDERQFSKHQIFSLDCFDYFARAKAMKSLFIRLNSNSTITDAAVNISNEDMQQLLKHNAECAKSLKIGKDPPPLPTTLGNANQVMKCLESVAHFTFGTQQERRVMTDIVSGYLHVSL
jgi:hypothetical protein